MSITRLANILYTQENIEAAKTYLRGRGVSAEHMRFPPVLSGTDPTPFTSLATRNIQAHLYTETVFFPITDLEKSGDLIGFDARYIGTDKTRLRFRKFKEKDTNFLLYYTHDIRDIDPDKPLLVTEGIVDAETLRPLGFPVVSPLTAMHSFKFCCFLRAISNTVYFVYDNDPAGVTATKNIMKEVQIDKDFEKCFSFLNYPGKDPNESVKNYGKEHILQMLANQIVQD